VLVFTRKVSYSSYVPVLRAGSEAVKYYLW